MHFDAGLRFLDCALGPTTLTFVTNSEPQFSPFLHEHQLLAGDDLHKGISRGIRLWDKLLLCASEAALTNRWVDGETNHHLPARDFAQACAAAHKV